MKLHASATGSQLSLMTKRSCEGRSAAQSQTSFQILKWPLLLRLQSEAVKQGESCWSFRRLWSHTVNQSKSNWTKTPWRRLVAQTGQKNEETWETRPCLENRVGENQFTPTQNKILIIQFVYVCIVLTDLSFSVSPHCAYKAFIYNFPLISVSLTQAQSCQWQAEVN